jgi:CheY-like chemotaxis protein
MLVREGYSCAAAVNGVECLKTLEAQAVDVILLDVMMPMMDGLAVCEHLRQDERLRRIPVILLTARDDIDTRSKGMALGVSEYLTKPVNRRELLSRINAQMHARAIDRQLSATAEAVGRPSETE